MRMRAMMLAALGAMALSGCVVATGPSEPAGPAATQSAPVTAFSALDVSAGVDVTYAPGEPSVTLKGDARYFDRIRVENRGETLVIGRQPAGVMEWWTGQVKVIVTGPAALTRLEASSGANVKAEGLATGAIAIRASSGANATVTGACEAVSADASSGGNVFAQGLTCADATASASSGANARVFAEKTASGEASSGANVRVYGPGALQGRSESSGGSVSKMN